ncbi:hypothetical protein NDU88_005622 [Pleurodeles waltl]|uniref:Uncharacterized protein n=1 Tax=Pleurodeles waltl TaxID=8319 RepID=A0AAV7WYS7_PLEWA|nr:hypothetical protein NDU88_005622 [Pleurodeles waltl]
MEHKQNKTSMRKLSLHEKNEQIGVQLASSTDKGSTEFNKAEHGGAEADSNTGVDFDDLSQEEWNELLASYSSEKEKECLTANRETCTPVLHHKCGGPIPDSSRGSPKRVEDSIWQALLRIIQAMADALSYHSAKMDVEILSSVATFVAGIDNLINDLNNPIKRDQEVTNDLAPRCCCSATLEKLS